MFLHQNAKSWGKTNSLVVCKIRSICLTTATCPITAGLRSTTEDGVRLARYAVETEGNIRAIMRKRLSNPSYSHTLDVEREVHLYLPHVSAEVDLIEDPFAKRLKEQHPLYALDVRGLGESLADDERDFFSSLWQ